MNTQTLERLKKLAKNNPDFAPVLEKEFPELIVPFVISGTLFMKKDKPKYIYLVIHENGYFRIVNVRFMKYWKGEILATNKQELTPDEYYLSKIDFTQLLRISGTKLESIRFIPTRHLNELHENLFDANLESLQY